MREKGRLYGVGVGPGDPELMTLKAWNVIKDSEYIALPAYKGKDKYDIAAYQIAGKAYPEIDRKKILYLPMPMIRDQQQLYSAHAEGARLVCEVLEQGDSAAFLTLGDVTVYSTFLYLQKLVEKEGYETCMVPGVPSFCAAAATLKTGLGEKGEAIHILPAAYDISGGLGLPGTKILMKAGSKMGQVKEALRQHHGSVQMVVDCGMEGQRVYHSLDEIPENAGYYSLLIVKEGTEEEGIKEGAEK